MIYTIDPKFIYAGKKKTIFLSLVITILLIAMSLFLILTRTLPPLVPISSFLFTFILILILGTWSYGVFRKNLSTTKIEMDKMQIIKKNHISIEKMKWKDIIFLKIYRDGKGIPIQLKLIGNDILYIQGLTSMESALRELEARLERSQIEESHKSAMGQVILLMMILLTISVLILISKNLNDNYISVIIDKALPLLTGFIFIFNHPFSRYNGNKARKWEWIVGTLLILHALAGLLILLFF